MELNRKNIAFKNISVSLFLKFINIGIVYLTIPFLLKFLGDTNYGIWVTVFSIISVIFFLDGGIINGLKTRLTESLSVNNLDKAKRYISTSYAVILGFSVLFFVLGFVFIKIIKFKSLLNISSLSEEDLKSLLLVCLTFIVFNFTLSIYKSFFYSIQKVAYVELSMLIYQLLVFLTIYYSYHYFNGSVILVAYTYGLANFFVGLLFTCFFFYRKPYLLPSFKLINGKSLKELFKISFGFLLIQLSMIVIYTSDNLLISNLLGPESVTQFDVVFKLFQVIITISVLITEPFWPLFSDAYAKKDKAWIYSVFKKYNKIFFISVFFLVVFSFFVVNYVLLIWVGKDYRASFYLLLSLMLLVVFRVFPVMYMYFLNGIGKIKSQVILYFFGAIINIPLSVYFVKYLGFGIEGIVLGTVFSIFLMVILLPIKAYKLLDKM